MEALQTKEKQALLNYIEVLEKELKSKQLVAKDIQVTERELKSIFERAPRPALVKFLAVPERSTEFIGISEACTLLGLSQTAVRNWCAKGRIPFYRIGNGVRKFKRSELNNLMKNLKN